MKIRNKFEEPILVGSDSLRKPLVRIRIYYADKCPYETFSVINI